MAKKPASQTVEVRMLVDYRDADTLHPANSVPALDADTAAAYVAAGIADDDPEAVAYAKSLASA